METVKLTIDGMGCGACVAKVKKALGTVAGVAVDEVAGGSVLLRRDPAQAPDQVLLETLSRAGYRAALEVSHAQCH